MKFSIPEISWHNRDPVLSVDFQPRCKANDPLRLATGGADTHILVIKTYLSSWWITFWIKYRIYFNVSYAFQIWYLKITASGSVDLEVAADLTRHQKAVNVVRWSPNGVYLASGDDESIIFVWKQKMEEPTVSLEGEEQYKESWVIHKAS